MPSASHRNPALAPLAFLVGDWQTEITNTSFLPDRSTTLLGRTSFAWVEEGAFLEMRQGQESAGPPAAVSIIGRDQMQADYQLMYFDDRPMARLYHMSFDGELWKIWREAPGFWQRFECLVKDGNRMTGYWEKSTDDGATWEHDFDVTYSRV